MIKEIYDYLKDIQIIDTHEHLDPFEKDRQQGDVVTDFLSHYFSSDLISAGLSVEEHSLVMGNSLSVREKWSIIERYWEASRYTGYGQALSICARDIWN